MNVHIVVGALVLFASISRPVIVNPPESPVVTIPPAVCGVVLQVEKDFCGPDDTALTGAEAESAEALAVDQVPGTAELVAAACSRCPNGTPQCWSDKSCDTFCGGKGFGSCVRINSCYKCCACAL